MSLQVWLPLTNGTLKQQGLKNISATIGGTVGLTDAGKLGKCATIGTAAGGITLPASAMTSFTECSVAFWINITSWNTDWDTIFQAGLGSTPWNNYIFGILRNQGNYLCFTVSNGSSTSSGSYASSNLTVGQWMHLAFTYGSSKCKIYINGVLDKEYSTSITPNFAGITHIAIGRSTNGSNYQCKCKLNDFRIYDHCLSPMEVKELAKGLVLHYPLNRNGWGQENLDNFSSVVSNWTMDGLTGSNYTDSVYGNVIKLVTSATNKRMYHSVVSTLWQNGQVYTVSFLAKADTNGRTCDMSRSVADFSPTFTLTTQWKRYSGKITSTATPGGGTLSFRINQSGATIYITQIKLEKGEIATPYCPSSSETLYTTLGLNGTTEYDCSGYCNNGTRTGTFTWTSDTPKYAVSTQFGSTSTKIQLPIMNFSGMANSYTFAWWQYNTSTDNMPWGFSNGNRLNVYHTSPLCWNTGDGSRNQFKDGSTTITPASVQNAWHHMVVTGDGTSTKLYIDGVYRGTATTYKALTGTQIWISGWDSRTSYTFNGSKECDFRIYATALSADDVKSLYQNSAYIDSSGNVYGAVHSEV